MERSKKGDKIELTSCIHYKYKLTLNFKQKTNTIKSEGDIHCYNSEICS